MTSVALSVKTVQTVHSIQSPQSAIAVISPNSTRTFSNFNVDFTEEIVDAEASLSKQERFSLIPGVEELMEMLDETDESNESDESRRDHDCDALADGRKW